MRLLLASILFFVFFPACGLVMMLISCNPRDYENTDIVLSIFVPLYGHAAFWTCD
ncbi:MAG: hypothetical protein AAFO97_15105 [Pseudomonadota bacterium]